MENKCVARGGCRWISGYVRGASLHDPEYRSDGISRFPHTNAHTVARPNPQLEQVVPHSIRKTCSSAWLMLPVSVSSTATLSGNREAESSRSWCNALVVI